MKDTYLRQRTSGLYAHLTNRRKGYKIFHFLLFTFCSLTSFSQTEENGITVRINHKLLEFSKIDDFELTQGSLSDFLSAEGKELLNDSKFSTLSALKFTKVFGNLRTSDSISISRTGDTVYIPPFWATFNVKPNTAAGYSKTIDYLKSCYPLVIYAHPNYQGEFLSVPDDTLFSLQQSLYSTTYPDGHINVPGAWDKETGKKFIKVGVFDSGIDTTHADLKTQVLTGRGYNFDFNTELSSWGTDVRGLHGHGTPVAGIIGAKRNNTTGVAGIAGGDGSDTTGVSLIDFRTTPSFNGEVISRAVVDAARSVGTYYDWSLADPQPYSQEYYWSHAAGFGIHIGNHSYKIIVANPDQADTLGSGKDLSDSTEVTDGPDEDPTPENCHLCREAFLFSLQNGVINVASSGNGNFPTTPQNGIYADDFTFPQNYDDTWIINVGGTGTDGEWFDGTNGHGSETNFFAQASPKMDVAAPWTNAINYTTASVSAYDSIHSYSTFAGTSASAPHVTGIAALLLSKYNQNCYSTSNLDPADVEYILEHSARDTASYDHQTGYGLVNAEAALQMIDFPEYQIVHPELDPVSTVVTAVDTITLFLNEPFNELSNGPLGGEFPLVLERYYDVVRHEYEVTYNFSDYLLPSTQILDYWSRPSVTNSLGFLNDTSYVPDPDSGGILFIEDTFKLEPRAEIVTFASGNLTLKGYYYHFIRRHFNQNDPASPTFSENFWYPINPSTTQPKMAYSIYLRDSLAPFYFDSCYAVTPLFDSLLTINTSDFESLISIFPNPGNQVTVSVNSPIHSIAICELNGKPVQYVESDQDKKTFVKTFDCSNLASGVYIIAVTRKDGLIVTKKWIKL